MRRPRKSTRKCNDRIPVRVTIEDVEDFFDRGKIIARSLDRKKSLAPRRTISFEDPSDLVRFLTSQKRALITLVRKKPNSLTKLAKILKRSRAAIGKDIQLLESVGILKTEYIVNPGHGKCKIVAATDSSPVQLQVQTRL